MTTSVFETNQTTIRQLHSDAQRFLNQGKLDAAQQCCLGILQQQQDHADAHFLLGMIAAEVQRFSNALEFIAAAIKLDPKQAEYHAHHGRCLAMLKRHQEAISAADRAVALEPDSALTLDTIGVVYSRVGEHQKASEVFKKAVDLEPENTNYLFNLASSLQFIGDFDRAQQAYERVIASEPGFYKAHSALSNLRKQTKEKNHIKRLENLLGQTGDDVDAELHVRHALAKEYEDLGDHENAFVHLETGNAKKRNALNYSLDRDKVLFETLEELFQPEVFTGHSRGYLTEEPVFVLGMPRTGTTLTERILTSHSQVFSAGELQNFALALKRLTGTKSSEVLDAETLTRGMQLDFAELGRTYLESTRPMTGHTDRFVDKMPLNYFYIGFIHLALPNAKIICLRRNPMDTCLSNFRQLFALNFSYYNYAYDLLDSGRYFILFDRLIRHWRKLLGDKILELSYEEIIQDQESQSRRLIDFCGLDWEDACLAFESNTAPVATASSAQVRQPIYKAAVARWKRYEKQLMPLRELLESEGYEIN